MDGYQTESGHRLVGCMDRAWTETGQGVDRGSKEIGQRRGRGLTEAGQSLSRGWAEAGQSLDRDWTEIGQRLGSACIITISLQSLNEGKIARCFREDEGD